MAPENSKRSGSVKKDLFIGFVCLMWYHKHAPEILQLQNCPVNQKTPPIAYNSFLCRKTRLVNLPGGLGSPISSGPDTPLDDCNGLQAVGRVGAFVNWFWFNSSGVLHEVWW
ncbi:hypothetical protein CDAR_77871 [Caerostris darwini]|uniref:Uncharacterized protein n=1 Tax=Caerostris darwini TaxID=1538125 RepID=A0AAV4NBY8_9ARAC|nr:hypothetical protein CDAR_77871 [Caerostris darwini]